VRRTVTVFRLVLRFVEPGGVGVPAPIGRDGDRETVHTLLDTDQYGSPHLPGTSVAGALRAGVRDRLGAERSDEWFGHLKEVDRSSETVDSVASPIRVLGSRLCRDRTGGPAPGDRSGRGDDVDRTDGTHDAGGGGGTDATQAGHHLLARASTAVDRWRGAARNSTLRVDQLLSVGARIAVDLRWDDADPADVEEFSGLLATWSPLVGRGVSRGRGRCVVEELRHGTLDLRRTDDLLLWTTSSGPALVERVAVTSVPVAPADPRILFRVPLLVAGPFLVGGGQAARETTGQGEDREICVPLREAGRFVVPGSALKGIVRSRAEFVLRSCREAVGTAADQAGPLVCPSHGADTGGVAGGTGPSTDGNTGSDCGTCWCCEVFGHGGGRDESRSAVGSRAVVRFRDATVEDTREVERTHVAVDRFTGGARENLLFTVRALEAGSFDLVVEDLGLPGSEREKFLALVRLILQDLDDGLMGIGRGTARGQGDVRVLWEEAEPSGVLPDRGRAQEILRSWVTGARE